MDEEIKLRAGLDVTDFERGESSMRSKLGSLGEHGHKSFLHASNGAREFHRLIERVGDQSGVMGTALKFALSPVAGLLTGAAFGFQFISDKIKELNQQLDFLEKDTDRPVFRIKDGARQAAQSIKDFNAEFEKWLRTRSEHDKITEVLKEQLDLLQLQTKEAEKLAKAAGGGPQAEALEKKRLQLEFALQSRALFAVSGEIGKAGSDVTSLAEANRAKLGEMTIPSAQASNAEEAKIQARLNKQIEDETKKKGEFWRQAAQFFPVGLYGPQPGSLAKQVDATVADLTTQLEASKERVLKNNDAIADETRARKNVADRLQEAQAKQDKLQGVYDVLSRSLESTRQALSTSPGGPADLRNPMMKATDDWLADRQGAINTFNQAQSRTTQNFVDRLTPFKTGETPITPEGQMKSMDQKLEAIRKILTSGIPVFGKD